MNRMGLKLCAEMDQKRLSGTLKKGKRSARYTPGSPGIRNKTRGHHKQKASSTTLPEERNKEKALYPLPSETKTYGRQRRRCCVNTFKRAHVQEGEGGG